MLAGRTKAIRSLNYLIISCEIMIRLLLLLLTVGGAVRAQEESQYAVRLGATGLWIDQTFRMITVPQLVRSTGRHVVGAGPAWLVTSAGVVTRSGPKLVGFQAGYRYHPVDHERGLSFFVGGEATVQRLCNHGTATVWEPTRQAYGSYTYQRVEWLAQATLGYGLLVRLGARMALTQRVGFGGYLNTGNSQGSSEASDIVGQIWEGYRRVGVSYEIRVGVRYQLGS